MKRSHYLKEFKIQVCKEAINTGNAAKIARQYELCPKMVNRWIKEYKDGKYYKNVANDLLLRSEYKPEEPIFIDDSQASIEAVKNLMSLDYILRVMQVILYRKRHQ